MPRSCQIANHLRRLWLLLAAAGMVGCVSLKEPQNPDIFSYSYLSLDFSGKGWDKARRYCADRGGRAQHLGTACGFFICTTEVACVNTE